MSFWESCFSFRPQIVSRLKKQKQHHEIFLKYIIYTSPYYSCLCVLFSISGVLIFFELIIYISPVPIVKWKTNNNSRFRSVSLLFLLMN